MRMTIGLCLGLLAGLPVVALAGGSATLQTGDGGGTVEVLWQDTDTLRLQSGDEPGYFLVRDGKAYSVSKAGGETRVMDMSAMMKMMRGAAQAQQRTPDFVQPGSFEATGRHETVAGVKGEIYRMEWTDQQGQQRTQEVVLTDDPTVVEMTRAYMGSMSAMFGTDQAEGFLDRMPGGNRGLLRAGEDFRISRISDSAPADSEFELPAEPMDMRQFMRGGR